MDFLQNTQICVKWKAWCALSSEREMLALLPDATPAYSIQVDSCVPLPGMTRWLGKGMPERSLTDPEISWQLFSSGMVDNLIWGLRRAKSPPTSSRLWRGILRRCCSSCWGRRRWRWSWIAAGRTSISARRLHGCCEDLAGIQMINMSANRLGARFVYMKIIFKLIKMKFRNNMVSTLSRLLKNWAGSSLARCQLSPRCSSPGWTSRVLAAVLHHCYWLQPLHRGKQPQPCMGRLGEVKGVAGGRQQQGDRAVGREGLPPGCDPFRQFCCPLRTCLCSDLGEAVRIIGRSQGLFYFYQFLSQLCTCL